MNVLERVGGFVKGFVLDFCGVGWVDVYGEIIVILGLGLGSCSIVVL